MPRPTIIQEPTFRQQLAVANLIIRIRKIVAEHGLAPHDAEDITELADWVESEFAIPRAGDGQGNINV